MQDAQVTKSLLECPKGQVQAVHNDLEEKKQTTTGYKLHVLTSIKIQIQVKSDKINLSFIILAIFTL